MSTKPTRAHLVLAVAVLLAALGLVAATLAWWRLVAVAVVGLLAVAVLLVWEVRKVALVVMRRVKQLPGVRDELRAARAHGERLSAEVSEIGQRVDSAEDQRRRDHRRLVTSNLQDVVSDLEALPQLYAHVSPRAAMPRSGGWALRPTDLLTLAEHVLRTRPRLVVELGSGTSTLWFSYLLETTGSGRLVSIEHDEAWVERSCQRLEEHGFVGDAVVEVRYAPLVPTDLPGHSTPWYDRDVLADLHDIDLLVVDGPPAVTGPRARHPAGHYLLQRLRVGGIVIVDDAARPAEKKMLKRWRTELPELEPVQLPGPRGRHVALRRTR